MRCPRCGDDNDKVVDSRAVREGRAIRRRRECLACAERFTTYEALETRPVLVIKRDGRRVAYDRTKVTRGIAKACEKRPVSLEEIETLVDRIEYDLAGGGSREVESENIGASVMKGLREIDDVAYVRFASVYHSFASLNEFMAVLRSLRADKKSEE